MDDERETKALIALVVTQLLLHTIECIKNFDQQPQSRTACRKRTRLDWEERAQHLEDTGAFKKCYKMSRPSFDALVDLLAPSLQVDEQQSTNRTGVEAISPENKLQMFLRYMSGGSMHDIIAYSGVSETAFYDAVHEVRDCLIDHPDLQIKFPEDEESRQAIISGFRRVSNCGVMRGCVGAIDGWLCQIEAPCKTEVPKVRPYYSGHYRCFGVNVQATCDHKSRFTAIGVTSPGGTGDSIAYSEFGLSSIVQNFPMGNYIVGDNAYANENKLLTPFTSPSINGDAYRDSFNYHLSQLRIRIEMAFGLLVRKWRIFRSPLQVSFRNVSRTIMAGCILHNWCINRRLLENPDYDPKNDEVLIDAVAELPQQTTRETTESRYSRLYLHTEVEARRRAVAENDKSMVRNAIVEMLRRNKIKRPRYNTLRRARENNDE